MKFPKLAEHLRGIGNHRQHPLYTYIGNALQVGRPSTREPRMVTRIRSYLAHSATKERASNGVSYRTAHHTEVTLLSPPDAPFVHHSPIPWWNSPLSDLRVSHRVGLTALPTLPWTRVFVPSPVPHEGRMPTSDEAGTEKTDAQTGRVLPL